MTILPAITDIIDDITSNYRNYRQNLVFSNLLLWPDRYPGMEHHNTAFVKNAHDVPILEEGETWAMYQDKLDRWSMWVSLPSHALVPYVMSIGMRNHDRAYRIADRVYETKKHEWCPFIVNGGKTAEDHTSKFKGLRAFCDYMASELKEFNIAAKAVRYHALSVMARKANESIDAYLQRYMTSLRAVEKDGQVLTEHHKITTLFISSNLTPSEAQLVQANFKFDEINDTNRNFDAFRAIFENVLIPSAMAVTPPVLPKASHAAQNYEPDAWYTDSWHNSSAAWHAWTPNQDIEEESSSVSDVEPEKLAAYARRWKRYTRYNGWQPHGNYGKGKKYTRSAPQYRTEQKGQWKKGKDGDKGGSKSSKGKTPPKGKMSYYSYDFDASQDWDAAAQADGNPSRHESS